jgi:multisubunit Na+/H+ antiporter MnhG subunit
MKFDLRFPIGLLFSFYGALLAIFGLCSNAQIYERSLNININLVWGIVLLVFGLAMLALAWRGRANKS